MLVPFLTYLASCFQHFFHVGVFSFPVEELNIGMNLIQAVGWNYGCHFASMQLSTLGRDSPPLPLEPQGQD
jgi:hypothetical protein